MRGIWACSVGLAALAALTSPSASAHVSVSPGRATAGSEATLTFSVPNETFTARARSRIDRVVVVAPRSVKIGQAQAKPGWTALVRGRTVIWRGGSIPYAEYDTFGLVIEVPERKGGLVFHASEHFAFPRGRVEKFPVPLEVGTAAGGARDTSGTAEAALAIAAGTAAVLLGTTVFLGLRRWLVAREE